MAVLSIQDIAKSYGKIQALNGISFQVPEGSVFGILGPNGSGKTTLLSIILDVLKADRGQYSWFGKHGSKEMRKKIGSLLETPNFYHYLSAIDNLRITSSISGRGEHPDEINAALKKVSLYDRRKHRFSSYSLGMKQRLAIGAALLGSPRVLVLDEPTNGLDPVGIAEIRDLIQELRHNGHTIIMASHLLDEVEKLCTHVAILKNASLLVSGPVDEVLADEDIIELGARDMELLWKLLSEYEANSGLRRENNFIHLHTAKGMANPEKINDYCMRQGVVLSHLVLKRKKLETKFFELTNQ